MSHRNLKRSDFEGKTVQRFVCDAVNIITFHFTDGTALAIEAELMTSYQLPGMVACDECIAPMCEAAP